MSTVNFLGIFSENRTADNIYKTHMCNIICMLFPKIEIANSFKIKNYDLSKL